MIYDSFSWQIRYFLMKFRPFLENISIYPGILWKMDSISMNWKMLHRIYQWGFKPFRKHAKPNPISVGQWLIQNVTRIFLYFSRIVCLYHKVTLNKKNQWNWNCCFSPMKLHAWWIRLHMHPLNQSQQSTKNDCHNLPIPFGIRFFKIRISNLRIILKKTILDSRDLSIPSLSTAA